MNISTKSPSSSSSALEALSFAETPANSLQAQPEASAYFNLTCDESICDRINRSIEEIDLPEFFTA